MLSDDIKVIDFLHRRDFFPDDNGAWDRIKTALAEAQKPSPNIARDETCEWCAGSERVARIVGRGSYLYCPMCGRKLSPVA